MFYILFIIYFFNNFFSCNYDLIINFNSRIINLNNCTYIKKCEFSFLSIPTGSGGAIYISSSNLILFIENSIFYYCSSLLKGGGISFLGSNNCECILYGICGFNCSTNSENYIEGGQFAFIETGKLKKNEIYYLSLSKCSYISTINKVSSIHLQLGNLLINNLNSSNNIVYTFSGITCRYQNLSLIKYCNFKSNFVTYHICLWFRETNVNISYNNIIENNSPTTQAVLRNAYSKVYCNNCIFLNNLNVLFSSEIINDLIINNCYIYHIGILGINLGNNLNISTQPFQVPNFFNKYFL